MPPSKQPTNTVSKDNDDDDNDEFVRTKILLVGIRRSGKTSITKVLFDDLAPKQALYTEPSIRLTKVKVDSFTPLEIWDCPGSATPESLGVPLTIFTSIIFVIDIQDTFNNPIARMIDFFIPAYQENPSIYLEVFVHKAEALSEEYRNECYRHVQSRIDDELADLPTLQLKSSPSYQGPLSIDPENLPIHFYLTSVYDHTIHEAFSRVLNHILTNGCLPFIEDLINAFCGASHSSKAFLFDTTSKIYVATDSSPVDAATRDICCDYVHMLNRFGGLYQSSVISPSQHARRTGIDPIPPQSSNANASSSSSPLSNSPATSLPSSPRSNAHTPKSTSAAGSRAPTPTHVAASPASSQVLSVKEQEGFTRRPITPPSSSSTAASVPSPTSSSNSSSGQLTRSKNGGGGSGVKSGDEGGSSSLLQDSSTSDINGTKPKRPVFYHSSAVSLTPTNTLVFHSITQKLALVALLPTDVWETKRGLVEFNVVFFREGVQEVYDVEQDSRRRKIPPAPVIRKGQ